jgi:sugar-phosphatase
MQMRCAAILFDMDGTLVDSTAVVEGAWRLWAKRYNLQLDEILAFSHGRATKDTMEHFRPGLDVHSEAEELDRYEGTVTAGVLAVTGAIAAVRTAQNGRWGVVTSAPRQLAEIRLAAAGLPIPKVLIPADEIAKGKPDPEGYLKAAKLLNVSPNDCLVFEDTCPGIDAARAAGMQVVGLLTTFPKEILACELAIPDFEAIGIRYDGSCFEILLD